MLIDSIKPNERYKQMAVKTANIGCSYSLSHIPTDRPNNLNKRTMCMNHTNKIECRQNKNIKTATTISPLEWAKENLEFKLSFSTSLSLFQSLPVCLWVFVRLFSCSQYARTHSVATHSHRAAYMHRYTTCRWIHTSHQVAAVCFFFFILFSLVRLCMPYLFSVEPESTEIRTDIVSFNRTLARNCCIIKSLFTFSFIELIRKLLHTKKKLSIFLNF